MLYGMRYMTTTLNFERIIIMTIDHIGNSSLAYDSISNVLRHKDKISHAHKVETGAPVPLEKKDTIQPSKEGLGKHIDITT
jgi:hypothetical protein